jgi:hypothetical protein
VAQTTPGGASTPAAQCQAGQVLQANGQSCLPSVATPAPVQSTGVLGQFPTDLQPTPALGPSAGPAPAGNCQPGQVLQASGQPCN